MTEKQLLELLLKDPVFNADIIDAVKKGIADIRYASGKGVLFYNKKGENFVISADDNDTADEIIGMMDNADLITAHQGFYIKKLKEKFGLENTVECFQAAYISKEPPENNSHDVEIKRLGEEYIPFILENYDMIKDEEYITGRIKEGMFGAFYEGRIAGFIGTHPEGSIGLLKVLLEYRRRGVAVALEIYIMNRIIKKGLVPYGHIETGNAASVQLQKKLDFSISKGIITWLY